MQEEWVICRIFHKCGEKRTPMLQVQGHSDASSSPAPTKSCLPPLLASPTSFTMELESQSQSPVLIHHHQDQKDFGTHPHLFPLLASPEIRNNHPSFSDLFFKAKEEQTIPKLSKTEDVTFYEYPLLEEVNNFRWLNNKKLNTNSSNFMNPFFPPEVDGGVNVMGFSGGQVREMSLSTSTTAFNRAGLQQVLDAAHIGIDSWLLPQHV